MSKLTESAKSQNCIKCGRSASFAAHYNGPRQHAYGKGRGIKCSDLASAEFCHQCDQEFTEGSTNARWANKYERSEEFMYWIMLTNIRREEKGSIKI